MSKRLAGTENPYIEDVLEMYSTLPNLTMMALGSSYWGPPVEAVQNLQSNLNDRDVHRYGNILGCPILKDKIKQNILKKGLDASELDIMITAGANQAFTNIALAICDPSDTAVILAPYYFSHKLALQLCGANVAVCPFDSRTLYPDWIALQNIMTSQRPKMDLRLRSYSSVSSAISAETESLGKVVLTTPSNPGGLVWGHAEMARLMDMCREVDSWVVVDQVYFEFLHDTAVHTFPCAEEFNYDRIVHIFSFSKSFGIPGWRVGYALFPPSLTLSFRKIQDTTVTHAAMISQKLALHCMDVDAQHSEANGSITWVAQTVSTLKDVRAALWPILEPLGTVYTTGAFYFLVPVPAKVSEEEAVDILARQHGVLLMPGSPFGAAQYMRLSYGGLPPDAAFAAVQRLAEGLQQLIDLSESR